MISYTKILNEKEILSFVNKFLEIVHKAILTHDNIHFIKLGVSVYGRLVGLGGIGIVNFIEFVVNQCMKNMAKLEKRYTLLLILTEFLVNAKFITFNQIRKYDYIQVFKAIAMEKNVEVRMVGLNFVDECVKEIAKRDSKRISVCIILSFSLFFVSFLSFLRTGIEFTEFFSLVFVS